MSGGPLFAILSPRCNHNVGGGSETRLDVSSERIRVASLAGSSDVTRRKAGRERGMMGNFSQISLPGGKIEDKCYVIYQVTV